MISKLFKPVLLLAVLAAFTFTGFAQPINEPSNLKPDWSKPYPPFRIVGNLYYVGTYDLACYLITTAKGNILINTGLAASTPLIKASIETLGFKFSDIKILLTTQAHYDQVGAMAEIKSLTGASLLINEKDAEVLADGGRSDYELGVNGSTYKPVMPDKLLRDRETIKLDTMKIVMLHHPGHTKGTSSFQFTVNDEQRSYNVLIANMPTIVTDKKFSEIPAYPGIAGDYASTFAALKKLSFDIWLSSHAGQFGMHRKHQPGDGYNPLVFADKKGDDNAVSDLEKEFLTKVNKQ